MLLPHDRRPTFSLAAALLLAACANETPYQPQTASSNVSGGYSSTRIEADRFRVQFQGNSLTERETVETYLLYRAAELTRQNGFDWFRTVARDTDVDVDFRSTPQPFYGGPYGYFGPSWRYYGTGFGWRSYSPAFGSPFLGGADIRTVERYEATAEIMMGRGPRPADPRVYSAADVLTNLQGQIELPEGARS